MVSLHLFCILPSLLLIIGASRIPSHLSRVFIWMVVFNIMGMLAEAGAWYFENNTSLLSYYAVRVADFISHVSVYGQMPIFGEYLYASLDSKPPAPPVSRRPLRIAWAGAALAMLLLVVSQFNNMYTWFDELNVYHIGDLFFISQIFPLGTLVIIMYFARRHRNLIPGRQMAALMFYGVMWIIDAASFLLTDLYYTMTYIASMLGQMILYINIQMDKANQWEMEVAESRAAVMLSQIRPHFLFNVLASISQLCRRDPPKAREATVHFARYLRSNMDFLTSKRAIAFELELQHVRHYLWLETMRFEGRLKVEFDIRAEGFRLPPLTLQPLVENAVRHGLGRKEEGGTITLRSEELEDGWRITVADDGDGFEPVSDDEDGSGHVSIDNVRGRLAAMSGGSLTINSAPGRGTVAVISLPKPPGRAADAADGPNNIWRGESQFS
ncbi:sensor histidine kinase [Deltaproteobacteria bacterium Smac51]|nr:sensor histidine kinase [Deltaproteobacteria bacterium Smac51]